MKTAIKKHKSSDGVFRQCRAGEGRCRYGSGTSGHVFFQNEKDAQEFQEIITAEQHGGVYSAGLSDREKKRKAELLRISENLAQESVKQKHVADQEKYLVEAQQKFIKELDEFEKNGKESVFQDAKSVYEERTKTVKWGRFDSFFTAYAEVHPETESEFRGRVLGNYVRHVGTSYDKAIQHADEAGWDDSESGFYKKLWKNVQNEIIKRYPDVAASIKYGESMKKLYGQYRATGEVPESAGFTTEHVAEIRDKQNAAVDRNLADK